LAKWRNLHDGSLFNPLRDTSPVHDVDDVTPTFRYSAMLRILGESLDFEEIERRLCLAPAETRRKGDRSRPSAKTVCLHDMWMYTVPVSEGRRLTEHIDALWRAIQGSKEYLIALKEHATVDVFLGYRSDWIDGTVTVPSESLEMFNELGIPFMLSIVRI